MKIADNAKDHLLIIAECNEDLREFAKIMKAQQIVEVERDGIVKAIKIIKVTD